MSRPIALDPTTCLPDLLTADQEQVLARAIEAGVLAQAVLDGDFESPAGATVDELRLLVDEGRAAWDHFMSANLRMVLALATEGHRRSGIDTDELFQEGCLGLAEAIRRYDARAGVRFATYGFGWVRNAVHACQLNRGGVVETSTWRAKQARSLRRRWAEMEAAAGRTLTTAEFAGALGRDTAWLQRAVAADQPLGVGMDLAVVPVACERSARAFEAVEEDRPGWLRQLGREPARVLALRYGLDDGEEHTYAECAERLRVSVSTVRRWERAGLQQARELLAA